MALVEQQNALERFADEAGYKVAHCYFGGDGVDVSEPALSRLMADLVCEGRKFNAVLVWNNSRLSHNVAELKRKLRGYGVDPGSVADGSRLSAWEQQLAELSGAADEEVAD